MTEQMTSQTETPPSETPPSETPPSETPPIEDAPSWSKDAEISAFMERNGFGDDLEKALKSAVSMEKKIGVPPERLVTLPEQGPDADPDGWKAVMARMGVPDAADGYEFSAVAMGEEEGAAQIEISDDQAKLLREGAHALGLTPAQAQGVIEKMYAPLYAQTLEASARQASEADQKATAATDALKRDWGAAYDDKLSEAEAELDQMAQDFGLGDDFRAQLERTGFHNDAWLVRLLAERSEARQEPRELPGGRGARPNGAKLTPAEMRHDLNAFDAKHAEALEQGSHPDHKWAVAERLKIIGSGVAKR